VTVEKRTISPYKIGLCAIRLGEKMCYLKFRNVCENSMDILLLYLYKIFYYENGSVVCKRRIQYFETSLHRTHVDRYTARN